MLRSLLLSAVSIIILLSASIYLSGNLLVLIIPALIFLSVSYLSFPTDINLKIARIIEPARLVQDREFRVKVRVTNAGSVLNEILLGDNYPERFRLTTGDNRVLCSLAAGETIEWEYGLVPSLGEYTFTGITASVYNLQGMISKKYFLKEAASVTVTTKALPLKKVIIRPKRTQVYTGTNPTRNAGMGIDYFGMREYITGDPPRLINWKTLARHQDQLFTTQFEQERMAAIGLVFDCRRSSYAVKNKQLFLDRIAPSAVEFANILLRDGNRVGLLVFGVTFDWTFIGAGKVHMERITRAISRIKLKENEKFDSLSRIPARLFPSQSQIIFFSPLLKNDYKPLIELKARGYQVIVISPNPVLFDTHLINSGKYNSIAEKIVSLERELLLRRIRQAGIQVIDWDLSIPFYQVISNQLNRQNRNVNLMRTI